MFRVSEEGSQFPMDHARIEEGLLILKYLRFRV